MIPAENRLPLFHFLLELADDHLVLGHRLSEWCGHAPMLEEDIALANIALDCLGVGTLLLEHAAEVKGEGHNADRLAFFRDTVQFRNCLLVEQPNGDFADTIARQFFYDSFSCLRFEQLISAQIPRLAEIAEKAHKEVLYHLRHSSTWILRLGDGTPESHGRMRAAIEQLSQYIEELFQASSAVQDLEQKGLIAPLLDIRAAWDQQVGEILAEATLPALETNPQYLARGREGQHSEHLGRLLSEMQSTARAFPEADW